MRKYKVTFLQMRQKQETLKKNSKQRSCKFVIILSLINISVGDCMQLLSFISLNIKKLKTTGLLTLVLLS